MGKIQRAVISLSDKSGIIQFAKDNGIRWASLGAGRNYFSITDLTIFGIGGVFCVSNALDAERTLLHHTTSAHSHIWIQLIL